MPGWIVVGLALLICIGIVRPLNRLTTRAYWVILGLTSLLILGEAVFLMQQPEMNVPFGLELSVTLGIILALLADGHSRRFFVIGWERAQD